MKLLLMKGEAQELQLVWRAVLREEQATQPAPLLAYLLAELQTQAANSRHIRFGRCRHFPMN